MDLLVFKTLVDISIYPIFFRVVELSIQGKFVILFMKEKIVFHSLVYNGFIEFHP